MQGDTKTESEREGKASFYGALNSDEVARSIYQAWEERAIRIILKQINRPPTRRRTEETLGRVGKGKQDGATFLRRL